MPSALVLSPVLIFVPLLAFTLPVLIRLLKPCETSELTQEWYECFHVASYQSMEGLLATEDFRFLSSQPGFDPSLARKLRLERLRIFRQYLNRLIVDFNRLHLLARLIVSQNTEDQSEFFGRLLKIRVNFWISIIQVEFSYVICRLGMRPVSVGVALRQLEAISLQLAELPESKFLLSA